MHWIWMHVTRHRVKCSADENGSVMLLVALLMTAFCGFAALAIDLGSLYVQKERAQAAADAGALAGADVLVQNPSQASSEAQQMATNNDGDATYSVVTDNQAQTVEVTASQTVPLWFARVFGVNTADVRAFAKAEVGTLTSGLGMVPIAVPNQTFTYGEEVNLSSGAGDGQSGNYGFLDFSGNGSNGVEYDIEHGYDFSLQVGELVSTEPGVMSGPVQNAIQYRLDESSHESGCSSYENASSDCSRLLYMPVIDTLDVSGKKDVTIVGFASFYLDGLIGDGGNQQIEGKFIRMIRPGTIGAGTDYGTYSVKLTPH